MEFLDETAKVYESYTLLDSEPYVLPSKKKEEKNEGRNAKMQLWKSLTESLKSKMLEERLQNWNQITPWLKKADTLLQYETKEWVYLKKKIMDVFFDYDQQKQVGCGPTLMGAGPSRNNSSCSFLAPQEANSPGRNYYLNILLANFSSVISRQDQQLTKYFNHFRQNQLTHMILR